eukprot:g5596.t2
MGNVSTTRRKSGSKELEKYCKPTGLYETCPWEERVVRRWIMEGQVAPRYPGSDAPNFGGGKDPAGGSAAGTGAGGITAGGVIGFESTVRATFGPGAVGPPGRSGGGAGAAGAVGGMQQQQQQSLQQPHQQQTEECPICFMHYYGVNMTTCCSKPLCTECYLQVRPPRSSVVCPFCNCAKFAVEYLGPPNKEQREQRMREEQRTIEARIHAEQEELMRQVKERNARENSAAAALAAEAAADDAAAADAAAAAAAAAAGGGAETGREGRALTGSTATGEGGAAGSYSPFSNLSSSLPARASFATVAERRLTEEQIRKQHAPPPAAAMEASVSGLGRAAAAGERGGAAAGGGSLDHALAEATARRHQNRRAARLASARRHSSLEGGGNDSGSEFHADGIGEGEIQQVEDLMLMEALRLSVLEEQARRERSAQAVPSTPTPTSAERQEGVAASAPEQEGEVVPAASGEECGSGVGSAALSSGAAAASSALAEVSAAEGSVVATPVVATITSAVVGRGSDGEAIEGSGEPAS